MRGSWFRLWPFRGLNPIRKQVSPLFQKSHYNRAPYSGPFDLSITGPPLILQGSQFFWAPGATLNSLGVSLLTETLSRLFSFYCFPTSWLLVLLCLSYNPLAFLWIFQGTQHRAPGLAFGHRGLSSRTPLVYQVFSPKRRPNSFTFRASHSLLARL